MGGTARPPGQGPYVMLTTQSDFSVGSCGQCVSPAGVGTAQMPGLAFIGVNGLGFPAPVLALTGRAHLRGS